jgi:superfamily II DNA or RNA helicase
MYRTSIAARARLGMLSHASVAAYVRDFRACAKAFEMYIADRLASARGVPFWIWEDVDPAIKDARGMSRADTGVDVTDGETCIVQCKLRTASLTYGDCGTFFGCALAESDGRAFSQWPSLLIARNSCSKLSPVLARYLRTRRWDMPVLLAEFHDYVTACLAETPVSPVRAPPTVLRDYQIEAVELFCASLERPGYIVLPTGTGKNVIIVHAAERILRDPATSVLVFVPRIVLMEQTERTFAERGIAVTCIGDSRAPRSGARVTVCVFASAHKVDPTEFTVVVIDEAHFVQKQDIRADLEETVADEPEETEPEARSAYAALRVALALPTARLFSATLDIPPGAPACTRTIPAMIAEGYLCNFSLHVHVFEPGATNASLARHIVDNYESMIVFAPTRALGSSFCARMNAHSPGCAKFIDCDTPRLERNATIEAFRTGRLLYIVNVMLMTVGVDVPIAKGVCFLHMPASRTHVIQVIGRALRPHPDKRMAVVVLPIVSDASDTGAKRARDFMRVLAHSNVSFARSLRRGGAGYVDIDVVREEAIGAEAVATESESAAALLGVEIFDSMGRAAHSWQQRYGESLRIRTETNGAPPPAAAHESLRTWEQNQRALRATMSAERAALLERLPGWRWQLHETHDWQHMYDLSLRYREEHNAPPPSSGTHVAIWRWEAIQRMRRDGLSAERIAIMQQLPLWQWCPNDARWTSMYHEALQYRSTNEAPPSPGGTYRRIALWEHKQRAMRDRLPPERKALIDRLPRWEWDPLETKWDTRYASSKAYRTEHRGVGPPSTAPHKAIYAWEYQQRRRYDALCTGRRAALDSLPGWNDAP